MLNPKRRNSFRNENLSFFVWKNVACLVTLGMKSEDAQKSN